MPFCIIIIDENVKGYAPIYSGSTVMQVSSDAWVSGNPKIATATGYGYEQTNISIFQLLLKEC